MQKSTKNIFSDLSILNIFVLFSENMTKSNTAFAPVVISLDLVKKFFLNVNN